MRLGAAHLLRMAFALAILHSPAVAALQVAAPYVELHTGPGRGYPVFHVAQRGERLTPLKRRADWYQVRTERGTAGWLSAQTLEGRVSGPLAPRSKRWMAAVGGGLFGGDPLARAGAGYHPLSWLTGDVFLADIAGPYSNSRLYGARLSFSSYTYWRLTPYATVGTGLFRNRPRGTLLEDDAANAGVISVGAGARLAVHPRLDVTGEYAAHVVAFDDGTESYAEWSLALLAWF